MTLAKPTEVDEWARVLSAGLDLRRHLLDLAQRQGAELLEWKRMVAPGRRRRQEEIRALESEASVLWVFSLNLVPGLAQTARYAEAMFRMGRDRSISDEEITGSVQARLARQAVLDDSAKRFKLLFAEGAVHRSLLERDDMREQVHRLAAVAEMPSVEMGMIPFAARERVHTYHNFSIIGDPEVDANALVIVGTVTRKLTVRDPDEIRQYIEHYRRLAEGALFGDELVAFLQEFSMQSPW